ncbi:NAD(P)/FAD-dependent oxidoreductase [Gulosibacter molinativorax]|uniref:FAD-dependent oxidoreductase n=1 Tax=Gulosibacter molinativorax TaxID=256821 RepID=A0ABT7C7N5_9MICO|nr:FAD-dependent oxidoreductase [Gulosibacter molinativorax]MDJ1371162.1 FAD-dependent oxidoreductase [Gulosibacter molinativorax]QUY62978.1 Hypotetical protein [Gulosibacter molinativorax]
MRSASSGAKVIVIGAGAIGASVARELAISGREVTVIDKLGGWGRAASLGNAGYICGSHAGPWATRREMGQALRWLAKRDSPLAMRPSASLAPFFARLLTTGPDAIERAYSLNRLMLRRSLELHRGLSAEGMDTGFAQQGLLDVYENQARFDDAVEVAASQSADGVQAVPVSREEIRVLEPALEADVIGGVLFPNDAHCDPERFTPAVGEDAVRHGATTQFGTSVIRIERRGTGVRVLTTAGSIVGDYVVIAMGAYAPTVARKPLHSLQGGKGFSFEFMAQGEQILQRPTMLQEQRLAVSPLPGRTRVVGMMQFAGLDERIDLKRVESMERSAKRAFPQFANASRVSTWAGLRPCTPDGLPMIGWANDRVMVATGHAMLGVALAPETGERVCQLFDGGLPAGSEYLDPNRYSVGGRIRP